MSPTVKGSVSRKFPYNNWRQAKCSDSCLQMSFATNQWERHMDPQNLSAFQCAVHLIENYKCIIHLYKNSQIKKLVFQCVICILQWIEKIVTGGVGYWKNPENPVHELPVSPLVEHNLGLYFLTIFNLLGFCCLLFFSKVLSKKEQAQSQWNSLCSYCYWGTWILGLVPFPGAAI